MTLDDLFTRALARDTRALGRLISLLEGGGERAAAIVERAHSLAGGAAVIGLTGAPGVGKSTLIGALTSHYRSHGKRVGVIAVDPSSPFSGGAVLGDRIRMADHFGDPDVFIRSMATRGHLGGVAAASADVADLLAAAGYQIVLLETIGVGQDDIEVSELADVCVLVLTPGQGDDIQLMKSGLMEVGDIYVINKADQAGVDRIEGAMLSALQLQRKARQHPVIRTNGLSGEGVRELGSAIDTTDARLGEPAIAARRRARARGRVRAIIRAHLSRMIDTDVASDDELRARVERVVARTCDPYTAARELLEQAGITAVGKRASQEEEESEC